MKRHAHWPRLILLTVLFLSACSPANRTPGLSETAWRYSDLRLIDAPGDAPGLDLVAVYLRSSAEELQIRLDFLDLTNLPTYDLHLALDTASGGTHSLPLDATTEFAWDTLVTIPASGPVRAVTWEGEPRDELAVWVQRDPVLDTLTIQLKRLSLPQTRFDPGVQVFLTLPGSTVVGDHSAPVRLGGFPPPPARVLLAFHNVFPAYTPATALRRWDGAHTGPLGGRHGLYNLLRTARNHSIPLVLLDLKNPSSLSALDYAGGFELVRELEAAGLLILPESAPALPGDFPAWVLERAVEESRSAAQSYGFPDSSLLYLPLGLEQTWLEGARTSEHRLLFLGSGAGSEAEAAADPGRTPSTWAGRRLFLASPGLQAAQVDNQGPTLALRAALVENALAAAEGGPAPILVLGGDLTESAWGAPEPARTAFAYLRAHPWIRPVNQQDLLAWPASEAGQSLVRASQPVTEAGAASPSPTSTGLLEALLNAPEGALTGAAWETLLGLYGPVAPQPAGLGSLRRLYQGQVGALLAASQWSASPHTEVSCRLDYDWDGEAECLLASETALALFEPGTGALAYLFVRAPETAGVEAVHQLLAPSSQLAAGLSPEAGWDLRRGLQADPAVIPGAFNSAGPFQIVTGPGVLNFSTRDGAVRKTYTLLPDGVEVCLQSDAPQSFQIPLVLDPWQRFAPGWWGQYGEQEPGEASPALAGSCRAPAGAASTFRWGTGPGVEVLASVPIHSETFLDSRRRMGQVEDPNSESPPGHYLPLPLALLEVDTADHLALTIRLRP